jgi:hypothetical protein
MAKTEPTYGEAGARSEKLSIRGTTRLAICRGRRVRPALRWIRSGDGDGATAQFRPPARLRPPS